MSASRTTNLLHGGDPVPGDAVAIRQLIAELRRAVQSVGDATALLRSVGGDHGMWTGGAADTFHNKLGALLGRLDTAHSAYQGAADALDRWVRKLVDAQADAVSIVYRAQSAAQSAGIHGAVTGTPPPALTALQHQRDQLQARALADARACAADLDAASRAVGHYAHSVWQNLGHDAQVLEQHLNLTKDILAINHVLKLTSEALGMAALVTCWIPGVGELVGSLALASAALLVVSDVYLFAVHKESAGTLLVDSAGLALGAAGRVGGQMFAAARDAGQFEEAAAGADAIAADFGTRAGEAAESWMAGEGEFAPVAQWVSAREVAAQDADLLSGLAAGSRANSGLWPALRSVVAETAHPVQTGVAAYYQAPATDFVKAVAESYHQAPSLTQWVAAHPIQLVPLGADLASKADDIKGFQELVTGEHPGPEVGW